MDTTLNVALSHQAAMRRHLDLIANNIANMNTTGFRREQVVLHEFNVELNRLENKDMRNVAYVQDLGVARDFSMGQMQTTGNPLDVALSGKGFFTVEDPATGNVSYTRNGSFKISEDGFLTLGSGQRVLNDANAPIEIDPEGGPLNITKDGTIANNTGPIGRLQVVNFDNEQLLEKIGDTLFRADEAPIPAAEVSVMAGMIEGSNVKPIVEMTEMMNVLRKYQSVAKTMDKYNEMRSDSLRSLGRVQ